MALEQDKDVPDQRRSDLTADEQAASDKGANTAFADAFGEPDAHSFAVDSTPRDMDTGDANKDGDGGSSTNQENDNTDPFGDLSPAVRELLAEIPRLRNDNAALKGRLTPTQQQVARLERDLAEARASRSANGVAALVAPAPGPTSAALEKVRGELPEVADAIEEYVASRLGNKPTEAPAPAAATPAAAPTADNPGETAEAKALGKAHPDWREVMRSDDYALWLSTQPRDRQDELQNTGIALVVSEALGQFKSFKSANEKRATTMSDDATRRARRTADAVTPKGGAAPRGGGGGPQTDHDAFLDGFNS